MQLDLCLSPWFQVISHPEGSAPWELPPAPAPVGPGRLPTPHRSPMPATPLLLTPTLIISAQVGAATWSNLGVCASGCPISQGIGGHCLRESKPGEQYQTSLPVLVLGVLKWSLQHLTSELRCLGNRWVPCIYSSYHDVWVFHNRDCAVLCRNDPDSDLCSAPQVLSNLDFLSAAHQPILSRCPGHTRSYIRSCFWHTKSRNLKAHFLLSPPGGTVYAHGRGAAIWDGNACFSCPPFPYRYKKWMAVSSTFCVGSECTAGGCNRTPPVKSTPSAQTHPNNTACATHSCSECYNMLVSLTWPPPKADSRPHSLSPPFTHRGLVVCRRPELQLVLERRRKEQTEKEEGEQNRTPLERVLLQRQQINQEVRSGAGDGISHTDTNPVLPPSPH